MGDKTKYEIEMTKHDHAQQLAIHYKALGEDNLAVFYANAAKAFKRRAYAESAN